MPIQNRKKSIREEDTIAEALSGRRQPASGAIACADLKGDVSTDAFLIESKITSTGRYTLKATELAKIKREAYKAGKDPMFVVNISGERWACIEFSLLETLLHKEGEE